VAKYRDPDIINRLSSLSSDNNINKAIEIFDNSVFFKRIGYPPAWIVSEYIDNNYSLIKNPNLMIDYVDFLTKIPQFMKGGIVKDPTLAVIGEGGSPELVIPINKEGINFIYSSLMTKFEDDEKEIEDDEKINIVNMINNPSKQTDETLFDLRNLSFGLIGV
jgi:hypothetical protein